MGLNIQDRRGMTMGKGLRRMTAIVAMAAVVVLAAALPARADVRMPKVFGDDIVLQREQVIPVWGWAAADEKVTVELTVDKNPMPALTTAPAMSTRLSSAKAATTAGKNGKWRVNLPAQKAGGPFVMTIKGKNTITYKNVLIGEVWFCSGQSNMVMQVAPTGHPEQGILEGAKVAADANNPKVRMITVEVNWQKAPVDDIKSGKWQLCEPKVVADTSAVAYLFAEELQKELNVPVGVVVAAMGGMPINQFSPPPDPAFWYNGMIAPVMPYGIRGALWYQGETDMNIGMEYFNRQKRLIEGWRKAWGQGDFPFYYVQIAPTPYSKGGWPVRNPPPDLLPLLWEAQTASLAVPNTGMAVITDVGDIKDIHPKNKKPVAHRLVLIALAKTYGRKNLVYSGPMYSKFEVEGKQIRIHFTGVGGGLVTRDGKAPDWFTIAGKDRKFVPAEATIDGKTIVVKSKDVAEPAAVRFGWDEIAQPNLMNKEGLQANSFRTDNWPREAGKK